MNWVMHHPDWLLGFEDETWWSRFEQPTCFSWSPTGLPLRLVEQVKAADDPERAALACYGLLVRSSDPTHEQLWLRFSEGRPVSALTIQFLDWCCAKADTLGKRVLVLIWDNASWHTSKAVRQWVRLHNQQVKHAQLGVRLLLCPLPTKSPWLNPIEPKWMHAKRRILEPNCTLSMAELASRVCSALSCPLEDYLAIPDIAL